MNVKKGLERPFGLAAVAGVIFYLIVSAALEISCDSNDLLNSRISAKSTGLLVALAGSCATFIIMYAVGASKSSDKFDKLCALAAAVIGVFWFAYVFLDDQICSPVAWRSYVTFLITPMLLISIAVLGRRWMSDND